MLSPLDNFIPLDLSEAMGDMRIWLNKLPNNPKKNKPWDIAALVRAAKEAYGLRDWSVWDGYYYSRTKEHSWLRQHVPKSLRTLVIDLQPPLSLGGPILFLIEPRDRTTIYLEYRQTWDAVRRQEIEADVQRILDLPRTG